MTASRRIAIDFAGLDPKEESVLKSVCIVSRQFTRNSGFEMATDGGVAQIFVMDSAGAATPAALVEPAIRGVLWVGQATPLGRSIPRFIRRV